MSQHDYTIDNGPGKTVRLDIQSAVQALASNNMGTTAPTTPYAGMWWLDQSTGTNGTLKIRDAANAAWLSKIDLDDAGLLGSPVTTAAAAPTVPTPVNGDLWLNTTNGVLSVFNGAAWVETGVDKVPLAGGKMTGDLTVPSLNGGPLGGIRNRIINGDMRIDQRYSGTAQTVTSTLSYVLDRWACISGTSGSVGLGFARSTTAPANFTNSATMYTNTPGVQSSLNKCAFSQQIEGLNVSDLNWGTANAQTVTISFWARSSTTGTQAVSVANATTAATRSYVATFTIIASNTWEYKTVTIPGDTSGTWAKDNTAGLVLRFDYGSGTLFESTSGSWISADAYRTSACVNLSNTASGNIFVTGVQLEVGSVATPFEHRSYGQELALCQRYYQIGTAQFSAYGSASNGLSYFVPLQVQMRAVPTYVPVFDYTLNCSSGLVHSASPVGAVHQVTATTTSHTAFSEQYSASAEL